MRRAFTLVVLVGSLLAACDKGPPKSSESNAAVAAPAKTGEAPKGEAPKGESFGAGVKLTTTTPIDSILAEPKKFAGQTVRVEGMVTDVCPKRGCWFEMAGSKPGQTLRFKVTDGEMVFPADSKGKKAVAEGVVAVKEMTLEESKEYAEYQAKEYNKPYDPASIKEPMAIVRIDGTGAVFVN
jgi:hypothetical protein